MILDGETGLDGSDAITLHRLGLFSNWDFSMQHTANVYLIDPSGELVDVFTFSTPAEDLMAAMR